ncbi:MAG: hypothetical protein ABJG41_18735 [Cyclobacteriaceae bacterium]
MKTNRPILATASIILGITLITSCTNKEETEKLRKEAQMMEQKLHERDSAFNEIMDVMTTLEKQVSSIKEKENIVSMKSQGDFSDSDKDQIVKDMVAIDQLIANSRETINKLSSKLDKADISMNSFKRRVNELSKTLENKTMAMEGLKESLVAKNVEIASLSSKVTNLETRVDLQVETIDLQIEKINDQHKKLNKAYFVVAPEKKLKDKGIVSKEGGFLWIGRTTELEEDVTQEQFVEIDIQEVDKLIINSEKMELVTDHPSSSYEVVKKGDKVEYISIKNPEKFWEISKFLVVSTKS